MADDAGQQQRKRGSGKPFAPGASGNPAGRPAGTRNKATVAIEALLEGQAQAIGQKAIDLALAGDAVALRLCMDRIAPVRRGRPVHFDLPPLNGPGDLVTGLSALLAAMASGAITPEEAGSAAAVLEVKRRAIETTELTDRIAALEKAAE